MGDGAKKESLQKRVQEEQIGNVTMLPPVPKEEVSRYISITSAALVNLKKSPTFLTVLPSKIFENAAMQKPILLGVDGDGADG